MDRQIIVFAKEPRPGECKTRLTPPLSPEQAASLYEAFVSDILAMIHAHFGHGARLVLEVGAEPAPRLRELAGDRFDVRAQQGANLGARLTHAFETAFGQGAVHTVLIGSDSPTMPARIVEEAFAALSEVQAVIGPSTDGGYYLVGAREGHIPVFEGTDWSTASVLPQTIASLEQVGWTYRLLPFWYDVDTHEDLLLLHAHLAYLRETSPAPATSEQISLVFRGDATVIEES